MIVMREFISEYPVASLILVTMVILVVGYLEMRFIGRVDIACITWFWALLVFVVAIVNATDLGVFRWILGALVLLIGITVLFSLYRADGQKR